MTKFSDGVESYSSRGGQDPLCVYKILDARLQYLSISSVKMRITTLSPS
jgi:hypothetical protein